MTEKAGLGGGDKQANKGQRTEAEDKLTALKQYRLKNGLCFKCGGKWSTTHSYPEHMPLHVLEELCDALELATTDDTVEIQSDTLSAEDSVCVCVCVLQSPVSNQGRHKNMLKLLARIGKHQVLVLVDSGSVGIFVSERLVQTLGLLTEPYQSATFKAVDGGQLPCSERVPALQWSVQGHKFKSDARILSLRCYDMILEEDWLEAISPVWVNYKTKKMRITPNGKRVALQGIQNYEDSCPAIGPKKLMQLVEQGGVSCCLQLCTESKNTLLSDSCQEIHSIQSAETVEVLAQI